MKKIPLIALLTITTFLAEKVAAQLPASECSAAFLGNKMVVDTYSPSGKCSLTTTAKGDLTVQTVALSDTSAMPTGQLPFKVGIRDKATGTLRLFSEQTFRRLPVQRVLKTCRIGDQIVLLTLKGRYTLPHNEIQVR